MRASIYNAMPIEDVKQWVEYIREFEAKRGEGPQFQILADSGLLCVLEFPFEDLFGRW